MSFGYQSSVRNLPTIRSYADAVQCWERAYVWRDAREEHDWRGLLDRRNKAYTVRKNYHNQAIHFRLHNTDVVTVFPDEHMEFKLTYWRTAMTATFFGALVPGMCYYQTHQCLKLEGRWYRPLEGPAQGGVTRISAPINGKRTMLSETRKFNTYTLNRKAWNSVVKQSNLKQLAATLTVFADAVGVVECARNFEGICKDVIPHHHAPIVSGAWVVQAFARNNPFGYGVIPPPSAFVREVMSCIQERLLVTHRDEMLTCTTKPYLTSEKEFAAWRRSRWGD